MTNATVDGNTADDGGGLTAVTVGSATATADLTGGTCSDNSARFGGGALVQTLGVVDFDSVDFDGNSAVQAGALELMSSADLTVRDASSTSNSASSQGGAIFVTQESGGSGIATVRHSTLFDTTATAATTGSAIDVRGSSASVTISNSQIAGGNSPSSPGGAVVAQLDADVTLNDSTVAYNDRYGVVSATGGAAILSGVIVWGNGSGVSGATTASCTDVQGGALAGSRNISSNPLFTNATAGDLSLQTTSPGKNACPAHTGTSLDDRDRSAGHSDMGAFDHVN